MTTDNKKVFAVVEGKEITQDDVFSVIRRMGQQGLQFASEEGMKQLADELVAQELLYLDAKKHELDKDPEFVENMKEIEKDMLKQYAMHKIFSNVEVSDEDLKQHYEAHKDQMKPVYRYHASHILVDTEEDAKKAKEQLDAGKDFAELASEISKCPSSEQGGDLGVFESGQMVPEFDQALYEMEEGETRGPIKTQFGYHIIHLMDKELTKGTNFEDVKSDLHKEMTLLKQQAAYQNKTRELEQEYKVERHF